MGYIRETSPQRAKILSTSEGAVCIEDSISSVEEGRVARLQFHRIEYQFHGEVAAGSGDAGTWAEGRRDISLVAVLVLEIPHNFVQDVGPD